MAEYTVYLVSSAERELKSLPDAIQGRVGKEIDSLRHTQRPLGARKLRGYGNFYRIRLGEYRIIYEIND